MYTCFICDIRQEKEEVFGTFITLGGGKINYEEDHRTPTADMLLVKILLKSTILTEGATFMTSNIKIFYMNMPLDCPEYVKTKINHIPQEIVHWYKQNSNICH